MRINGRSDRYKSKITGGFCIITAGFSHDGDHRFDHDEFELGGAYKKRTGHRKNALFSWVSRV